jgi:hypothetical protein
MRVFWPDGKTEIWGDNRPPLVDAKFALIDCNINVQTLLIRRAALERLGGFDERFGILDDRAIAIRIGELGLNIGFFADPPVALHRRHGWNYSSHSWRFFRAMPPGLGQPVPLQYFLRPWLQPRPSRPGPGRPCLRVPARPHSRLDRFAYSVRHRAVQHHASEAAMAARDLDFGSPLPPIPREPDRGDLLARQERGATAAWD